MHIIVLKSNVFILKSALNFIKKTAFVICLWSKYDKTFTVEKVKS